MAEPVNRLTVRQEVIHQKSQEIEDRWERVLAGDVSGLEVCTVKDIGRGIKTTRFFKRNEVIMRYVGEVVTLREALRRELAGPEEGHFYRYDFKVNMKPYVLDASREDGTYGRLINHSRKNPNVQPKPFTLDGTPAIFFKALVDIEAGVELRYDYGERRKHILEANPWLKK